MGRRIRLKRYALNIFWTKKINFQEFKEAIDNDDQEFAKKLIQDLVDGKPILIKSAFSKKFVEHLKKNVKLFWRNNPNFYKMLEGCKDFHRIITPDKKIIQSQQLNMLLIFFRGTMIQL